MEGVGLARGGGVPKLSNEPHANGWREHLALAHAAPRCGVPRKSDGLPCQQGAMPNGRCRMHGGMSTGPRTAEGLERSRKARWQHGHYSARAKAERQEARRELQTLRALLAAAMRDGDMDAEVWAMI